jgi:hypothetical protein
MKKLWKTALIVATLSLFAAGAVKLGTIATPSQADAITRLGVPVPSQCQGSRIQVPTSAGLEWKQLVVCPDEG